MCDLYDCQDIHSTTYRGSVSTTQVGVACQNWVSTSPHTHRYHDMVESGVGDHDYCRNPDGVGGVWCYTVDPETRWDWCNVPFCTQEGLDAMNAMFIGE